MTDQLLSITELEQRLHQWAALAQTYPFFDGEQNLPHWLDYIETSSSKIEIPRQQWADSALFFFRGELQEVMRERKDRYLAEKGTNYWDWEDFKGDITILIGLFVYFQLFAISL
jgi:hypothetical protein